MPMDRHTRKHWRLAGCGLALVLAVAGCRTLPRRGETVPADPGYGPEAGPGGQVGFGSAPHQNSYMGNGGYAGGMPTSGGYAGGGAAPGGGMPAGGFGGAGAGPAAGGGAAGYGGGAGAAEYGGGAGAADPLGGAGAAGPAPGTMGQPGQGMPPQ